MKIMSDDIMHKFDVGGVVLDIKTTSEAENAFAKIMSSVKERQPDARLKGVLVRKMIPAGEEVILGVKRDPAFGAVLMFGLGGIFVEILKDITFRIAPLGCKDADEMIAGIKAFPLLNGARGRTPRDIGSIANVLLRLSQLASDCPQIQELDINPLIVLNAGEGCFVADAKIML
jgi:acetyltransferase